MPRFEMKTGPYKGFVREENHVFIAETPFEALDLDMQAQIFEWAERKYGWVYIEAPYPVSLDQLACDYEASWKFEEFNP